MENNKMCVIGLGYIGLPTAAVFANQGWQVTGVDVNSGVVDMLNKGKVHIKEIGLEKVLSKVIEKGSFSAKMVPEKADVFIIAVPTPHNSDLTADLNILKNAIRSIIPVIEKGNKIIVESTIPPRTMSDIVTPIIEESGFDTGKDIFLAYCPERVLPGRILIELFKNNRIVGGTNTLAAKEAADVYRTFVEGKVIETSAESAEMAKLMENTFRDVNIALANELTKISEALDINALEVISLANEHPRVNIHQPGPGVGGHCLAVDPYFIIEKNPENAKVIAESREVNESMPAFVVDQVKKLVSKTSKIAVFGLAYKGNIDDIRESPALKIVNHLYSEGYKVQAYDPYVKQEQVQFQLYNYEKALRDADVMLILTDHNEFKNIDWEETKCLMKQVNVLDTKNCVENVTENINYYNFGNLYELKAIKTSSPIY